jgi:cohesin complex subunit SA-1/2
VEAVKSLSGVYAQTDYIGSLNHFTERFKPRLIEMATSDTELAVRVAVIQVLSAIDRQSLLEDEEREKMCLLIFDEEVKVRRAVSGFVRGMWEEVLEERLVGRGKPSEEDRQRAGVKALAMLLVKWGRVLDGLVGEPEDSELGDDEEESARVEGSSRPGKRKRKEVAALVDAGHRGRTALAVEALWEEVECIRDWEGLLEILLLDHSAAEGVDGKGPRANGKARKRREEEVDEAWRLEEVEESVLLEVLVAALRRAKADVAGSKKVV